MIRILLFIICLSFSLASLAQSKYKYEREERISKKEFPENARTFLKKHLPEKTRKIKYYKESDSTKISYEVKVKYKKRKYSIEFNRDGILEDVEVTVKKKKHIPKKVYAEIQQYFKTNFSSHRLKKIQQQYRNTTNINNAKTLQDAFSEQYLHAFEIIAEVKQKSKRYFIEITFSASGDFEQSRIIIRPSYDHILY